MRQGTTFQRRSAQRGVGLIEVLVAVLVLAIGLLGIAAMQATALRNSQSSFESTQAVAQTYAAFDILRARKDEAIAGIARNGCPAPAGEDDEGGEGEPVAAAVVPAQAAASSQVDADLDRWVNAMKVAMGDSACASISCLADENIGGARCSVTIQWDDSRGSQVGAVAGSAERTVTTVGAI